MMERRGSSRTVVGAVRWWWRSGGSVSGSKTPGGVARDPTEAARPVTGRERHDRNAFAHHSVCR